MSASGRWLATDLLAAVSGARQKPLQEYSRSVERDGNVVACGLTEEMLTRYLETLVVVANWAIDHDIDEIQYA